jgi:cell division protein FtsQ
MIGTGDKTKRSDKVRARRAKRQLQSPKQVSSRAATKSNPPVVARRRRTNYTTVQRKPRTKTRRRYNLSLGTLGAELRLPALPVVRTGWRLLSAVMVVGLLLAIYSLWTQPQFRVLAAEVVGLERLTSKEINAVLDLTGASIFSVDSQLLTDTLMANFSELENLQVRVGFPAKVVVEAEERQPVLAWQQAGLVTWVDEQGVSFPPRGESGDLVPVEAMDAPPAALGSEGQELMMSADMVAAILTLQTHAPADTVIVYDAEHGLGWADSRGWQVYFGHLPNDMEERISVYNRMVEKLEAMRVTPTLISVEYLHAPYFRIES